MTPVIDIIACDDIREESNGKLFFIGVYSQDIRFKNYPSKIHLCLWIRFIGLPEGTHPNTLRISFDGEVQHSMEGETSSDGKTPSQAFIFGIPIEVPKPGDLCFEVEFSNGYIAQQVIPCLQEAGPTT